MECVLRVGSNFCKAPVVDSGASRHFFGRDVSSCIVEVKEEEREFLGVEGGISRSSKDVTVELPGVETVDGGKETVRLDGSFSQSVSLSLLSVNALRVQKVCQPFWVELPRKGEGMFRARVHEREGVLVLNSSGVRMGVAAAPTDDVDRFSDFSFDDDGEVDANAMGGADPVAVLSSFRAQATFFDGVSAAAVRLRLPAGQLEVRAQQQGVESEREEAKQSRRDAAPAAESEETEREEEIVLPDISDDDSLFGANLLKSDSGTAAASLLARESGPTSSREEKGVQVVQEDERVQEAQDDGRKREKEKKEKEKRVTHLLVDKKVNDVMIAHLPGRVPEGSPKGFASGEVSQLLRAMYGLKDAPRLYAQHFKRIAGECGWEEVSESVFVKKEAGSVKAVMAVYIDDLLVFSDDPVRDLEPLRKRLEMDEPEILECGGEIGYTGMEVKRTEEGFALSQKAYLESIPVQKEDLPRKSLSPELIKSSAEEETDDSESLVSVM
uniref:Reverse transcriptase Ty1/copia-type domain-containing protein n=1 Tax=Chromera velia CCMP2878 TaxID=1169474 RepID=A0A0G4HV94_9ALVE|eukprot:Cvel_8780.t1-p1 / transcript=Cvel_8780.t1 / gene=Cvel_8780 / organism=Chromera_velia_CCMP2878 / gene_product=hypothetical protein / transcript_product=hypothetical protein / location=Cvel_scaffold491:26823-29960(-) / protein_length=496 / sequence_SO=supercontig / SO=protein_coding / is_pseudo=false